jgi:hypothetical protein
MSTVLPIVLWYGGVLGIVLAALLVLWALTLYAIKQSAELFTFGILAGGLVIAIASAGAVSHATALNQTNQLLKVREPLIRLVAGSVYAQGTLADLRTVAEPSPDLTTLQSKFDRYETSLEDLLQAEWQYHRGGPWNEGSLLHKMTWDLNGVLVHHARWEQRPEALECPSTVPVQALSEVSARLQDRLQNQRMLAEVIGEQFEGYDFNEPGSSGANDVATVRALAGTLGVLALLSVVAMVFVWRKRSRQGSDALVAIAAIVLAALAGWLLLGTGAEQERLRASLFDKTATVYRETIDLNDSLKTMMPVPRSGVFQPLDSKEKLIVDYVEYQNSIQALAQLVRIWDRAVLTGMLDTGLVSTERIQTHDDLLTAIRLRTLTLYRQYVGLDRRIADSSCRSEWFSRQDGRTREDELLTLP